MYNLNKVIIYSIITEQLIQKLINQVSTLKFIEITRKIKSPRESLFQLTI